jgi:hypothetical protein
MAGSTYTRRLAEGDSDDLNDDGPAPFPEGANRRILLGPSMFSQAEGRGFEPRWDFSRRFSGSIALRPLVSGGIHFSRQIRDFAFLLSGSKRRSSIVRGDPVTKR